MARLPRPALAILAFTLALPTVALAQSQPAPTTGTPPARAKWAPPVKGVAEIGYLKPETKVVGKEVVTKIKVKNLSVGSIALLRVDEYWYDRGGNMLPGDMQRWKKLFMSGEVIEIELRVPHNPKYYQNRYNFSHANGTCKPKLMKKF